MEKGTLAKWNKQEGDELVPGEVIAEVETDKATVDFEFQDEGYLAKILVPEGTADIPLGKTVGIMVEEKENVEAFKEFTEADLGEEQTAEKEEETETESASPQTPPPQAQQEGPAVTEEKPVTPAAPTQPETPTTTNGQPQQQQQTARKETHSRTTISRSPLFKNILEEQKSYEDRFGPTQLVPRKLENDGNE